MAHGGCIKGNIKTHEQYCSELAQKQPTYVLLSRYTGNQNTHEFRHTLCGNTFKASATSVARGKRICPCLQTKPNAKGRTLEDHRKQVREWRGADFDCLAFDRTGPCTYIHLVCGRTWQTTQGSFRGSQNCPHCVDVFRTRKIDYTEVRDRIRAAHGAEYIVLDNYADLKLTDHVLVEHRDCGNRYRTTLELLTHGNGICHHCPSGWFGAKRKATTILGREFQTQGYEHYSLPGLVDRFGISQIVTGCDENRLRVGYEFDDTPAQYTPDFYVPRARLIVEVKSVGTFGLMKDTYAEFFGPNVFYRNATKAATCLAQGYEFELHLYKKQDGVPTRIDHLLPDNWFDHPKSAVAQSLGIAH